MYRVVNIIRRHWLVRLESFRHKSIGSSRTDPALMQLLCIVADVTAIHLFMDSRRRWWEWNSYLLLFRWHLTETSHPICPHFKCLEEGKTTKKYNRSKSHHHFLSCFYWNHKRISMFWKQKAKENSTTFQSAVPALRQSCPYSTAVVKIRRSPLQRNVLRTKSVP